MAMRDRCSAALAARGSAAQSRHLARRPAFVDEDQVLGIKVRLRVGPDLPVAGDVGPILLGGVGRFFGV